MARILCLACKGRYADVDESGAKYFHVCPDQVGRVVMRAGDRVDIGAEHPQPADITVREYAIVQPGKRDERLIPVDGGPARMVSEGAGALVADDDDALDELLRARTDEHGGDQAHDGAKPSSGPAQRRRRR